MNWILDLGFDYPDGRTDFNIFDESLNSQFSEHIQHSPIIDCLRFSSYDEALEYSNLLKEKYFNEIERLSIEKIELNKKFHQNLEKDRLTFDRSKKINNLNK